MIPPFVSTVRPRRAQRLNVLVAVAAICALVFAASAAAALRTVIAFDRTAKQTPENLAFASDGTLYLSLAFASEIRRIAPDGKRATLTMPTMGGITVGVAIDRHHGGDLDVAVRSTNPAAAGIWRVPVASFAHPTRIAPLPTRSFPNGLTFDTAGNLYVADSALGRIWRLARGATRATVWSDSPLLAPTGMSFMSFPLPGANGIKIRRKCVYVSNTSAQTILEIPLRRDGGAGRISVKWHGIQADDFAFAADGDLYAAENPQSKLIRITPTGAITTLATTSDGLANTSAVAFDPRPHRQRDLYITNSAYFTGQPTLDELRTDTNGQKLQ